MVIKALQQLSRVGGSPPRSWQGPGSEPKEPLNAFTRWSSPLASAGLWVNLVTWNSLEGIGMPGTLMEPQLLECLCSGFIFPFLPSLPCGLGGKVSWQVKQEP